MAKAAKANKAVVEKDDTPSKIAKQYKVNDSELKAANPGVQTVKPGQVIKIPSGLSGGMNAGIAPLVNYVGGVLSGRIAQPGTYSQPSFVGNSSGYSPVNQAAVSTTNQTAHLTGSAGTVRDPRFAAGRNVNANYAAPNTPANIPLYGSSGAATRLAGSRANANYSSIPAPYYGSSGVETRMAGSRGNANYTPPPSEIPFYGSSGVATRLAGSRGQNANYSTDPRLTAGRGMNANYGNQQQPFLGSSSYLNPAFAPPPQNGTGQGAGIPQRVLDDPRFTPGAIARPGDTITPENYAQWVAYWNNSAIAGYDISNPNANPDSPNYVPPVPVVMTRAQIWEMKAAARRAEPQNDNLGDGGAGYYAPYQYQYPDQYQYETQSFIPEPLVRQLTWSA